MPPLVSILIPAYNAARWIGETLESALGQDWDSKEIIVVDDGSQDDTVRIARTYEARGVKVIANPHHGACVARNRAFRECSGEFVQWLDADDLLAPDKISSQMREALHDTDPFVLYSGSWSPFFYQPAVAKSTRDHLSRDLDSIEWLLLRFTRSGMMPNHAWLVSRTLSEAAGPWNETLLRNQDGEYFVRVVAASRKVRFVPEAHCHYRKANLGSISWCYKRAQLESLLLSAELSVGHLLAREDSPRTRAAAAAWLDLIASEISLAPEAGELLGGCDARIRELGGAPAKRRQRPEGVTRWARRNGPLHLRLKQFASQARVVLLSNWERAGLRRSDAPRS